MTHTPDASVPAEWLDVTRVAHVEASSEQNTHPIADAFLSKQSGWMASEPGEQAIRVAFRHPTNLRRLRVVFDEPTLDRTQEFTLRWSSHRGETYREIVRQQFNFSPHGATREAEDYRVELQDVSWLELRIVPDIQGGEAVASLAEFRIG